MDWMAELKENWVRIGIPVLTFLVGLLWAAWRNSRKRLAAAAIWMQKHKSPHAVSFSLTGVVVEDDDVRLQLLSPGEGTTLADLIGNEVGEERVREAARGCSPVDRVIRLTDAGEQRTVLKAVRDTLGAMFAAGSQAWSSGVPCRRVDWAACLTYDDEDPESMEEVSFRVEATPVEVLEWIHANEDAWRGLEPLPGEGHQKTRIEAEIGKAKLWAEQQAGGGKALIRVYSYWPDVLFTEEGLLRRGLEALAARV